MIAHHVIDAECVPATNPAALAYMAEAERLGHDGPEPLTLSYGPDRAQKIDVHAPPGARKLPVLIFLHGGAWIHGHLGWLRFMAEPAWANGLILVAATYRLAPRLRWPAQRDDALSIVETVQHQAASWGGDPRRVAIAGHSAGGHLAATAALDPSCAPIVACLPVSAPFDLRHGDVPLESEQGRVYRYLLADRAHDADASPLLRAGDAKVPFHIVWGEHDLPHVLSSGQSMTAALRATGVAVTRDVQANADHFSTHLSLADPASPWWHRLRQLVEPATAERRAA